MYVSAAETPSDCMAGPTTIAAMMNDAVTGTANPSRVTATAENSAVRVSTRVALSPNAAAPSTIMPASPRPRPVSVVTPTMTPAAAQVAATGSTPRAPLDSAWPIRRGVIRSGLCRKDSRKASAVA